MYAAIFPAVFDLDVDALTCVTSLKIWGFFVGLPIQKNYLNLWAKLVTDVCVSLKPDVKVCDFCSDGSHVGVF